MFDQSREDLGHISGLVGHPGYELLVKQLQAREKTLVDELSNCKSTDELLNKTRYWQAFHHIVDILASEPQKCYVDAMEIDDQHQKQLVFEGLDHLAPHRF